MNRKWIRIIVPVLLVASAVIYLIVSGVSETGVYYYTVEEVLADRQKFDGQNIRISGDVVEGSISYDQQDLELTFAVVDREKPGGRIGVIYNGVAPDSFTDGVEVIVEGRYDSAGNSFRAGVLLAKCPSKYVSEDGAGEGRE